MKRWTRVPIPKFEPSVLHNETNFGIGTLKRVSLDLNHNPLHVMAGLDPAIHVFAAWQGRKDVDARDKSAGMTTESDSTRAELAFVLCQPR